MDNLIRLLVNEAFPIVSFFLVPLAFTVAAIYILPLNQQWLPVRWIKESIFGPVATVLTVVIFLLFIINTKESQFAVLSNRDVQYKDLHTNPSTSYSSNLIEKIVRSLEWGSVVFNAPEKLKFEESSKINILLTPAKSEAELATELRREIGRAPDKIESATVHISNRMRADLTGTAFTIQSTTPSVIAVRSDDVTRWGWTIAPTKSGNQTLFLTISAMIDVSGRDTPIVIKTYEKEILITISPQQRIVDFISNNWQWLCATLLLPIATIFWKKFRKTTPTVTSSIADKLRKIREARRNK